MATAIPRLTKHMLLLSIFIWTTTAKTGLLIDVSPSEIHFGLSDVLDVNCSFTSDEASDKAVLISLVLSRAKEPDQNFTEIAAVTLLSTNNVNLLTSESVKAEGLLSQKGESYLHLLWDYPSKPQAGWYQCSARLVDDIGRCSIRDANAQVSVNEAISLENVIDVMREMKQHMEQTADYVKTLQQQVSLLENTVLEQDNHRKNLERNISEMNISIKMLEKDMSRMNSSTNSLEHKVSDLRSQLFASYFVNPPLTYEGKAYYLSKEMYHDVKIAQTVCQTYDGYLAEMSNYAEHNAIKNFLNSITGFEHVLIGGTDEDSERSWILPTTGQYLPFTEWYGSEPDSGRSANCLILTRSYQWRMQDIECVRELASSRFLCESLQ